MQHVEGTFLSKDNLSLYYQCWSPTFSAKAMVGIVHGLGSHSGRFEQLVKTLVQRGYGVCAMDLRGHGRSPGQRGFIQQWGDFRNDFDCFWQLLQQQSGQSPCFAIGHSLGAIVILDYALHYPETVPYIVTLAPALKPIGVPAWRLQIGYLVSQIYPRFSLNTGIPKTAGMKDEIALSQQLQDPLRHTKGTARLVTEFFKTIQWINEHLPELKSSVLALHGTQDLVALPDSSKLLFEQIPVIDKEYRIYPNGYHDLHNDIDARPVLQDITNWLDRHINGEVEICKLYSP